MSTVWHKCSKPPLKIPMPMININDHEFITNVVLAKTHGQFNPEKTNVVLAKTNVVLQM